MEIKVGIGLGEIRFGMSIDTVQNKLGKPDRTRQGQDSLLLQYNDLRSMLWFNPDLCLHWIQCSHVESMLFNRMVIGEAVQPILSIIETELNASYEMEDYDSMESYCFHDAELELQAEYATIAAICFGHLWEDDQPVYPSY